MIKVIDDWYITVEANPINYVVKHGDGKKDKNGKMKDRGLAYFSTLRGRSNSSVGKLSPKNFQTACGRLGMP